MGQRIKARILNLDRIKGAVDKVTMQHVPCFIAAWTMLYFSCHKFRYLKLSPDSLKIRGITELSYIFISFHKSFRKESSLSDWIV